MRYYRKTSLVLKKENDAVICLACQRRCKIEKGAKGFCGQRVNIDGELYVPWGYFSSLNIDPIEKKPLYHFLPGSKTLSFGMFGCNFRCLYCQNWEISQKRDLDLEREDLYAFTPDDFYRVMLDNNIRVAVSTYNEPTITIEWAYDIFSYLKRMDKSIKTGFVSNGYLSEEAVEFILPVVDFIKIDIKVFEKEKFFKLTSADLELFIKAVRHISTKNIHIEFVNLVVEGFNDDKDEFDGMIDFVLSISCEIPLHLTLFHPDYKMLDKDRTSPKKVEELIVYAKRKGLRYVYGGNYLTPYSDTLCPSCNSVIVERGYMSLEENRVKIVGRDGFCFKCGYKIYGVWA